MNNEVQTPTRDLLERVGMLSSEGRTQRSDPVRAPEAFKILAERLLEAVREPYDLIVVRDLFGDKVLGYQLSLISGKPVKVSYEREGIIALGDEVPVIPGSRALLVADTHFTVHSIRAAVSGAEQAGAQVIGAAFLLRVIDDEYPFPVWELETHS